MRMARTKTGERQKRQARAVVRDDSSDEEQEYEVFNSFKSDFNIRLLI